MSERGLDEAIDELYAGPPGDFVAARDALAKRAKADGDAAAAAEVAGLRRPTVAAWLANLLVRERRDEVDSFVELGVALREATETLSGTQLRELSAQRHRLVQALVGQARNLGQAAGQRVGEEALRGVEDSLHAALADPDAAAELLAGRLTHPLSRTGYASTAAARPAKKAAPGRTRKQRERRLAAAWSAARKAAEVRDRAAAESAAAAKQEAEARRETEQRAAEVARLRDQLEQAETGLAAAEQARQDAAYAAAGAAERAEDAAEAADRAREEVTALQADGDAD
jgi:hypothetical protein